jgi:DNA-binding NtrC family response regulator
MAAQILLTMDDLETAVPLNAALEAAGYATTMVSAMDDVRAVFRRESPDLLILTGAVHESPAIALVALAREAEVSTLALIEPTDSERAERVARLGATAVMTKPARPDEVVGTAIRLVGRRRLQQRTGISGESAAIQEVLVKIEQMAPVSSTVLVQGESGTGKELVAKAIHDLSPRRGQPFIAVDCAAIPDTLLESELFGHEKGAFTGAAERRLGRFELADGGTIFLDEIGDVPTSTQVKRAGEPGVFPRRRHAADQGGCACGGRHESQPSRCRAARRIPRRPLLPAQRPQHLPAAAQGTAGGYSPPPPTVHPGVCQGPRPALPGARP